MQADAPIRQILLQIQQTAVQSQRALNVSRQQMTAKERERRILQLTIDEISQMDNEVNLYKGIGKMYVCCSHHYDMSLIFSRFMMVPRPEMEKDLKTQEKELSDDINSLTKKVGPLILPVNAA